MGFHIHGFTNGMTHNSVSYCGRLRLIINYYGTFIRSIRFLNLKIVLNMCSFLFHLYQKAKGTLYLVAWSTAEYIWWICQLRL